MIEFGERVDPRLGARERLGHREQAGDNSLDIAVDHHRPPPEADRGDRGSGVATDAGERAQRFLAVGERAERGHPPRAGEQVARAGIIAEPRPGGHQLGVVRRRQAREIGPARGEALEIGAHARDLGLLEHHLGKPDAIGIGEHTSRRRAPGQIAGVGVVPVEKRCSDVVGHRTLWHGHVGMTKPPRATIRQPKPEPQRGNRVRPVSELLPDVGRAAFRKFGFVQHSVVSRWCEIVGERYARVSAPESIRFPPGKRAGGVLALVVAGAHAPMMQHIAPEIVERVNRFFGYPAVERLTIRHGQVKRPDRVAPRPELQPVSEELGINLRGIADPELKAVLESLAAGVAASEGLPKIGRID